MLLVLAAILIILWIAGYFVLAIGGGLIHVLLVIAIVAIAWHIITMSRSGGGTAV